MAIAVLTRAVLVPIHVLERLWPGGEAGYRAAAPNQSYRCDGHLAAVEFMATGDVEYWIESRLKPAGIRFPKKGPERDAVVFDAHEGMTTPCAWLDFHLGEKWAEARLKGAPETPLTGPVGWSPDGRSTMQHMDAEACGKRLKFLGVEGAVATFIDEATGIRQYIGAVRRDSLVQILDLRLHAHWDRFSPLREEAGRNPDGLPDEEKALLREAALECERIARAAEPLETKALWLAGLLSRMAAEWKLSARLWRLYLAGEPDDAGSWMELTWCLGELGEREEALATARKAVELAPDNAGAAANMAASLRALGRHGEALTWADRAVELDPEDEIAIALRASLEAFREQAAS